MITIVKIIILTVLTSFIIVSSIYSQTAEDFYNSGDKKSGIWRQGGSYTGLHQSNRA